MSFLGLGSSSAGGLDVGTVKATLGYDHDKRGLKEWDRAVDGARRDTRKPIKAKLEGDYDSRGFAEYEKATGKARRGSSLFLRAAAPLGGVLKAVAYGGGAAGLALGVGFVAGTKKAIEASSDLNESLNAAEAIFESQGKTIAKWSETTADSFGLARSESLQGAASIGAMLKPMGFAVDKASSMSMKMVELAGDMASFNNQDPAEMLERLRSGLAGESEPLRQFGVDLRLTAVEQFALKEGIIDTGEKLEGQKQVYAMYQKILSDTTDQQGDFGRTSEGMANAQRRLRANTIDLSASFGNAFRPLVQGAIGDLNEFLVQMKEGRGEGGQFADFISGLGHDIEGFADSIEDVLSDKSLDPKEKAEKIFGMFADVAGDAITAAVPKIADAAAAAAPKVADRFVHAFLGADSWGKLALGAFLITKFGGFGALRGIGSRLGTGLGTGVAEGAAATVAGTSGGAAAAGLGGRLKGVLGAAGIVAKRIGIVGLGYAIGEEVIGGIQYEIEKGSDDINTSLGAIASHGKGLYGLSQRTLDSLMGENAESDQAKAVLSLYESLGKKRGEIAEIAQKDIEGQAKALDLTTAQRKEIERMFHLLDEGRKLGKGRTSLGVDLSMDPKKLAQIQTDLGRLKAGVYTNAADIEKASKRLGATIVDQFGQGTSEARHLTAENMRATAQAIALSMKESGNYTDAGLKRIKKLIGNADLLEGLHPAEFGRSFANAFGRAGDVTKKQVDNVIGEFKRLPKGARQAAFDAMDDQLTELRRGGKLSQNQVKRIRSAMLAEFGGLKTDSVGSTFDLVKGVLGNFGALGNGVAAALSIIRDNTNAGLSSFNVSPVKWIVKTIGNLLGAKGGGKAQGKARGGYLEGPSRGDVVPVLAGKDEAFVTSWQQKPINTALQFAAAHGVVPYGHLGELFSGERQPHAAGPTVQRRASGGYAFPGVTVENNQKKGDETGAVNKALEVMGRLAQMHIPYVWGGGHGGFDSTPAGLDCSGAVSLVLHEAGLLASPLVSGALESWGAPGPGAITVYANPNHAWMEVNGKPWGTSVNDSSHGLGFYGEPSASYKSTFTARHAAGAVMTELARVLIQGPDGPMKQFGQAAADKVWKSGNAYLKANMPNTFGGGDANVESLSGGKTVGASTYAPDAYTGTVGAAGKSLIGKMAFAELGMGHNLGSLPFGAKLKIGANGRVVTGEKLDIGLGGGDVDGHRRDIDLWYETAEALGLPKSWLGLVQVAKASRGGIVRMSKGGIPGKISELFGQLTKTRKAGKRDEIRDEIHHLEERLHKKRSAKRKATYKAITTGGDMTPWQNKINGQQDHVAHIEEQIGGLETANGLTEPREIEQILRGMGLDPESDLSKLTDEQKDHVRQAVDAEYRREEREVKEEVDYNQKELRALLKLRSILIHAYRDGQRRIGIAERRKKKDEDEKDRLLKLAREIEKELEQLHDELSDLERGKAPKQAKGESDKAYKQKKDAWENHQKSAEHDLKGKIERVNSRLSDTKEKARGWGSAAKAEQANIDSIGSFDAEALSSLTDVQGTDRSMEPNVDVSPLGRGGVPQFGGSILSTQAKLAELRESEMVRPDYFKSIGSEGGGEGAGGGEGEGEGGEGEATNPEQEAREAEEERLKEERVQLLEEENERLNRNRLTANAQAPIFAAAAGLPNLLQRGGFAAQGMLAPFVGSYRIGSAFVPRDGLAMVHRGEEIRSKERVVEAGGGDTHILMTGDLSWLSPYVQAHIVDELEARGQQAAAASRRPAAGVIARKVNP